MNELRLINREEARKMDERRLQREIGRRANYLKNEFGMDKGDAANFVVSLLNLGTSLDKIFESRKTKKNDK